MKTAEKALGAPLRAEFPIFGKEPLIYFDSAATTQKPQCVIDVITRFYSEEYGTVHRAIYRLATSATKRYDEVREKVRSFMGAARTEEIIFTRGTTDSINLVALTWGRENIREGDEIVISEMEHHSNMVPWQMLAKEVGAHLKIIPVTDDAELDLEVFETLLTARTKLVAIAHVANSTGTINPIAHIIKRAHSFGAKVLIDGAQAVAHMAVDMQSLDCDFYAFSGHKAFGPTGIGILYGKYELLDAMPPLMGGGDMIEKVTLKETTFQKPPLKFEAGTPSIAQVMGLGAALDFIQSLGLEHIAAWEEDLLTYATEQLSAVPGLKIIGTAQKKSAIISFILEGVHPLDLGTLLDLEGIALRTGHHCAQPLLNRFGLESTARLSFAPFNTREEVDIFMKSLYNGCTFLRNP
ncbi:MAG: Cysteine desulfurase [Chlamydiae bacterium]|nr:Cysteine desulfurase [Chlamydiota bacterium]